MARPKALMVALNYPTEPVRYGSMGRPAPGTEIDVIDSSGRRLPAGQEGDLAIKAQFQARRTFAYRVATRCTSPG
jgi:acyl-coenzyme A synthetase/AMP-(fatty) acid ligase